MAEVFGQEKNQEEENIIVWWKNVVLFRHRREKTRYYRTIYWTDGRNQPPAGINSSAVRNTYPQAPAEERKSAVSDPPLDPWVYSRVRGKNKDPVSSSSCWRWWIYSPENWHKQWYFSISGRTPGDRTDHGRMALCSVCITSRRVYLQRTAVAGVPRYGLDGHPKGQVSESEAQSAGRRLVTLEQKLLRMQAQQENISGQ